jgi:choline dehydrogenase-like flavoprotein
MVPEHRERADWNFVAQPNPSLNGRAIPLDMGKVLGGGSSINLMCLARGHKNDWDFFASEAGDGALRNWRGAAQISGVEGQAVPPKQTPALANRSIAVLRRA